MRLCLLPYLFSDDHLSETWAVEEAFKCCSLKDRHLICWVARVGALATSNCRRRSLLRFIPRWLLCGVYQILIQCRSQFMVDCEGREESTFICDTIPVISAASFWSAQLRRLKRVSDCNRQLHRRKPEHTNKNLSRCCQSRLYEWHLLPSRGYTRIDPVLRTRASTIQPGTPEKFSGT